MGLISRVSSRTYRDSKMNDAPPRYNPEYIDEQPLLNIQTQTFNVPDNYPDAAADWKYPIFSCFDNWALCCTASHLAPITFGEISHKSGFGEFAPHTGLFCLTALVGFAPCFLALQRQHIRRRQKIAGNICSDCISSTFCTTCVLVQHAREVGAHYERPEFTGEMYR